MGGLRTANQSVIVDENSVAPEVIPSEPTLEIEICRINIHNF